MVPGRKVGQERTWCELAALLCEAGQYVCGLGRSPRLDPFVGDPRSSEAEADVPRRSSLYKRSVRIKAAWVL